MCVYVIPTYRYTYIPWNIIHPKNEWGPVICDNIGGFGDNILSEMSQEQKDMYHVIPLMWDIRKLISEGESK
jgi:hypothetical protein